MENANFFVLCVIIGAAVGVYDLLWKRPGQLDEAGQPDGKDEE